MLYRIDSPSGEGRQKIPFHSSPFHHLFFCPQLKSDFGHFSRGEEFLPGSDANKVEIEIRGYIQIVISIQRFCPVRSGPVRRRVERGLSLSLSLSETTRE